MPIIAALCPSPKFCGGHTAVAAIIGLLWRLSVPACDYQGFVPIIGLLCQFSFPCVAEQVGEVRPTRHAIREEVRLKRTKAADRGQLRAAEVTGEPELKLDF